MTSLESVMFSTLDRLKDAEVSADSRKRIHPLRALFELSKTDPLMLWHNPRIVEQADALLQFLAFELDDDEEALITAAHMAYFYYDQASRLNFSADELFHIRKNQVVLVETFADYFRHTVAMCYRGANQQTNRQGFVESLQIADQRTNWLSYLHLRQAAELNENLAHDSYLIDVEATHTQLGLDSLVLDEALLLHKVLVGYIAKRVQLGSFEF